MVELEGGADDSGWMGEKGEVSFRFILFFVRGR